MSRGVKDRGWRPYIGAEAAPAQPKLNADAGTRHAGEGRCGARKEGGDALEGKGRKEEERKVRVDTDKWGPRGSERREGGRELGWSGGLLGRREGAGPRQGRLGRGSEMLCGWAEGKKKRTCSPKEKR